MYWFSESQNMLFVEFFQIFAELEMLKKFFLLFIIVDFCLN